MLFKHEAILLKDSTRTVPNPTDGDPVTVSTNFRQSPAGQPLIQYLTELKKK